MGARGKGNADEIFHFGGSLRLPPLGAFDLNARARKPPSINEAGTMPRLKRTQGSI